MTDLTPPPARDLPPHRRAALRRALEEEIRDATPHHGVRRRFPALPVLAAAVAAALVVGVVWSARRADPVAVPGAVESTTSTPGTRATSTPAAPVASAKATTTSAGPGPFTLHGAPLSAAQIQQASTPPTVMNDPAKAYAACIALVHDQADVQAFAIPGTLTGRVAATNGIVTTVVAADDRHTWTCNIAPDSAVSYPASTTPPSATSAKALAFALNSSKGYGEGPPPNCPTGSSTTTATLNDPRDPCGPMAAPPSGPWNGELLWVGGRLPAGVNGLAFTLPDGRSVPAVVRDGYWVVQDFSVKDWVGDRIDGQTVTVRLSDGRTVPLTLGQDAMCNQTSHGC